MSNKVQTLIIPFFKVDIEILNDSKIKMLRKMPAGDSLFVLWIGILSLAMKSDDPGTVELGRGIPFSPEMLAAELDMEIATVHLGLETFVKLKMIEMIHNDTIFVTNFEKHQSLDRIRQTREATRKRVAKYRERKKIEAIEHSNSYNEDCNADVTNEGKLRNGTDKIREDYNRIDKNRDREEQFSPSNSGAQKYQSFFSSPDPQPEEFEKFDPDVNRQRFMEIKSHWKLKPNLPSTRALDVNTRVDSEVLDVLAVFPNNDIFQAIDNLSKCYEKIELNWRPKSFSEFIKMKKIEKWLSFATVEEYFPKQKSEAEIKLEKTVSTYDKDINKPGIDDSLKQKYRDEIDRLKREIELEKEYDAV